MDIQSVIVSVEELNKTKNAIANAIRAKGVSSQGRFSGFVSEINSIKTDGQSGNSKNIINNLDAKNIFRKTDTNELEAIGNIKETYEAINNNSARVYSLYPISNVKIADGPYKDRINQSISLNNIQLLIDNKEFGHVQYTVLDVNIIPKRAENEDGSVVITYTTKGNEHSFMMPIKDILIRKHNDNIYALIHNKFDINNPSNNLEQRTNVNNNRDGIAMFERGTEPIKVYDTRPAIFDKLDSLSGGEAVDAILLLFNNNTTHPIPVKLVKSIQTSNIPIGGGNNAAVLELDNNKFVFHYSDTNNRLYSKCVVAKQEWSTSTDTEILNKIKECTSVGIIMRSDGSPISEQDMDDIGID